MTRAADFCYIAEDTKRHRFLATFDLSDSTVGWTTNPERAIRSTALGCQLFMSRIGSMVPALGFRKVLAG